MKTETDTVILPWAITPPPKVDVPRILEFPPMNADLPTAIPPVITLAADVGEVASTVELFVYPTDERLAPKLPDFATPKPPKVVKDPFEGLVESSVPLIL